MCYDIFLQGVSCLIAFLIFFSFLFQNLSVSVSVLTLTFIAYDRYNAICRPLQFSTRRSKAAVVICAIWTISSLVGIPDAISLETDNPHFSEDDPCVEEGILWDLTMCGVKMWSENVDFSFTIVKVSLILIML